MEISKKQTTTLNKVIYALFGIFISSLIFALLLQRFQETGIWLGVLANLILVFLGYYYIEKGSPLRIVTWSILITLIISTIAMIVGLQVLENMLEGF